MKRANTSVVQEDARAGERLRSGVIWCAAQQVAGADRLIEDPLVANLGYMSRFGLLSASVNPAAGELDTVRSPGPVRVACEVEEMESGQVWRVGVAGAVVHEGRVLLVRHTYGETEGRWALPGGYTAAGERLDESAVRELREETGLSAEVVDNIGMVTRYTDRDNGVFVVFRMRAPEDQAQPDEAEVSRVGWFSLAEIAAMTDKELWPDSRHPALAALRGEAGLLEDARYPGRSDRARGFLVKWE
jgi:ADP-ribose pyrophosphatase YjhB (NUDIX family)